MKFFSFSGNNEGCRAADNEIMTSIHPNHMRTFIRVGRAAALRALEMELCVFVEQAGDE